MNDYDAIFFFHTLIQKMPQFDIVSNYYILIVFYLVFFLGYIAIYLLVNSAIKFALSLTFIFSHAGFVSNFETLFKTIAGIQKEKQLFIFLKF